MDILKTMYSRESFNENRAWLYTNRVVGEKQMHKKFLTSFLPCDE